MYTLYTAPGTCALASHLALEHAGASYRAIKVSFADNQQRSEDYLKLNPKGRVPALVTPSGVLTETPAILQYISQMFPQAGLAPLNDPFALARMNEFNSYLCSTLHIAHAHRMRGHRWVDDPAAILAMQKKVPQTVGDCFALIESQMFAGPWVLGETFSVSDYYLYTLALWMEGDSVDPQRFPKVFDHRQRMAASAVAQRVQGTTAPRA